MLPKNFYQMVFAKIQIELEILLKDEYILLTFLNLNFLPQDSNVLWTPKVSPGIFEISIVKFLFASFFFSVQVVGATSATPCMVITLHSGSLWQNEASS